MKNIDDILKDTDQDPEELLRTLQTNVLFQNGRGIPKGTEDPQKFDRLLNLAQTDHLNTLIRMLESGVITSQRITT